MKCKICGDNWEYTDEQYNLDPFKICLNCRLIGPEKPGVYVIPKESDLPSSVHDRNFIIVPQEEIPRIYQEFFNDTDEYARKIREKYGKK